MIYLFDSIGGVSEEEYASAFELLTEERKQRVLRYRFRKDRLLCAFAYVMLMYGLYREGYLSDVRPVFTFNSYGKPYLRQDAFPGVFFNFSHCEKGIICGISEHELGVDIEAYVEEYARITDLVLHPGERGLFDGDVRPDALFTQLWTMKEAYTKMYGCGLSYEITELDFSALFTRGACGGARGGEIAEAHTGLFDGAHLLTERREEYVVSVFSRQVAFCRMQSVSNDELREFIRIISAIQFQD